MAIKPETLELNGYTKVKSGLSLATGLQRGAGKCAIQVNPSDNDNNYEVVLEAAIVRSEGTAIGPSGPSVYVAVLTVAGSGSSLSTFDPIPSAAYRARFVRQSNSLPDTCEILIG